MALSKDLSEPIAGREVCLYQCGDFYLDPVKRVLRRGVDPVPMTPKVFDTLLALVRHSGRVIGKDELLAVIWPDTFFEDGNLALNIFILRKTLPHQRFRLTFSPKPLTKIQTLVEYAHGVPQKLRDAVNSLEKGDTHSSSDGAIILSTSALITAKVNQAY